ncbi:MAG: type II secretion system F family protein [Chloroflexi bacterium]|nr:type II secretion system F family protein [Chloroflexota bacterium]
MGPGQSAGIAIAQQLATLLEAGLPILRALEIVSGSQSHPAAKVALGRIGQALAEGRSFSNALAEYPQIFPTIFVRLASIGEETGDLAPFIRRAADYLEGASAMRSKVRASLTYPAIVMFTSFGALFVLLKFSIPMLSGLLEEFHTQLPLMTRIIITVGNGLNAWLTRILAFVAIFVLLVLVTRRTIRGRRIQDRYVLLRPPFGKLLQRSAIARFAQTLVALMQSGIPLRESLLIAIGTTENVYLQDTLKRVHDRLLEGASFSASLQEEPFFPSIFVEMVRVGEGTGKLAEQIVTLENVYRQQFDQAVSRIVAMLEPILILIVGGVVGLIGTTVISTVYSVLPSARGGGP